MDVNLWRNRISNRIDLVARLTHLTRGLNDDDAFEKIWKILMEKKLIGSGQQGYVIGDNKAVCFQEVPLYSIAETLLFETELNDNKRYSWFGIRFNKILMYRAGARPVLYGDSIELKRIIPLDEYWRIVDLNLSTNDVTDWSHEREWRYKGDYKFEYKDIEILVKNDNYYRRFIRRCIDEGRLDILEEIHGIIPINSVIS